MGHLATLCELIHYEDVKEKLMHCKLSDLSAGQKASLLKKSAQALIDEGVGKKAQTHAFFVPGRIEVLGKHTDYAGGRSVIAATEKGFCLVEAPRKDKKINVIDAVSRDKIAFVLDSQLKPKPGHWSNYLMTVARRLSRNFSGLHCGCDVAFASDLPPAAGMSSSSALMAVFFLALSRINQLDRHEAYKRNIDGMESLAGYLGTIENGQSFGTLTGDEGVGTFGGSEDHTAILCCKANMLSQYSYCPVRFERSIAVPDDYVFAVAGSGVVAEKTKDAREKYNRASLLASTIADVWRKETGRNDPHLAAAAQSSPEAVAHIRDVLRRYRGDKFSSEELLNRFEHFYAESMEIIPAAGDALSKGDVDKFGTEVDRSQHLAERLLGNQVSETIFLAKSARWLGAVAASAFGAGFGGSVWAVVHVDQAKTFLHNWTQQYFEKFAQHADKASFFLTRAGPAALELGQETTRP